jgi:hypothetical protein
MDEEFRSVSAEDLFKSRWSHYDLKQIDQELHEALIDQEEMLAEHQAAMRRGWVAALKRMEDAEIEQAKAVFPDAVIRIREK